MIVKRNLQLTLFIRISTFLAFTISAYGQSSTAIKRVEILSSTFDPQTRVVKIIFTNNSHADITAYGVSIQKQYQNNQGAVWSGSAAWGRDFAQSGAYYQIEARKRAVLPAPSRQPIHSGQTAEESNDLSGEQDLVNASMRIDMVAYSDGTAEVENEVTFQRLLISRQADLSVAQKAAEVGAVVLSNKHDPHPMATLIGRLSQAKAVVPAASWRGPEAEGFAKSWAGSLDVLIEELQRPDSDVSMDTLTHASGNSRSRERDYIRDLVEVQTRYAAIFSKHKEIRRVNQ